jgi:putative ABC transport system ATP-binding protein
MRALGTEPVDATTAKPALIEVEHLSRHLNQEGQRTLILDDVTFSVPDGSLFAINGPSGSGKSTVLNMLTGLDHPSSGRIVFGDQELRGKSEDELSRWRGTHVGIVFQFFQLLPTLSARENVMLALELGGVLPWRAWDGRARQCLELVGVGEFGDRLPSAMSGGQQQRVAIARALANDPPVLVADEPTGNLDSHSAEEVFEVLAHLPSRGKTVIYVTHDTRLAARATARVELLDGRIVASEGTRAMVRPES